MPDSADPVVDPRPADPAWAASPASPLPSERSDPPSPPERGVGLCLSGGGYRAMLFHAGVLWRLLELGYLDETTTASGHATHGPLARVAGVSGGAISSALLALRWNDVRPREHAGALDRFKAKVVAPLRELASFTIAGYDKVGAFKVIRSVILPGSTNDSAVRAYERFLFDDADLQDFPDAPRFILCSTNLQSGALFRFSKPHAWDWKVGKIEKPRIAIARAAAAASAFPPFLSPATFEFPPGTFVPGTGGSPPNDLQKPPFTTRVELSDGGVYDNLALETVYKSYRTVLTSDAAAPFEPVGDVANDWVRHSVRVALTIDAQVRALRVRQLIAAYKLQDPVLGRKGAYWGIASDIAKFPCAGKLDCPRERTKLLAEVGTDLSKKTPRLQEQLINWGYAICDAGMRAHVDKSLPPPAGFPYPASGV